MVYSATSTVIKTYSRLELCEKSILKTFQKTGFVLLHRSQNTTAYDIQI